MANITSPIIRLPARETFTGTEYDTLKIYAKEDGGSDINAIDSIKGILDLYCFVENKTQYHSEGDGEEPSPALKALGEQAQKFAADYVAKKFKTRPEVDASLLQNAMKAFDPFFAEILTSEKYFAGALGGYYVFHDSSIFTLDPDRNHASEICKPPECGDIWVKGVVAAAQEALTMLVVSEIPGHQPRRMQVVSIMALEGVLETRWADFDPLQYEVHQILNDGSRYGDGGSATYYLQLKRKRDGRIETRKLSGCKEGEGCSFKTEVVDPKSLKLVPAHSTTWPLTKK